MQRRLIASVLLGHYLSAFTALGIPLYLPRILSNLNIILFSGLLIFVLLFGPTLHLLNGFVQNPRVCLLANGRGWPGRFCSAGCWGRLP